MKPLEVTVDHETFRISERRQPNGTLSYDIAWLSGPGEGTYGFTVGRFHSGPGGSTSNDSVRMSDDELLEEVRGFVESFYEAGRTGKEDFPEHVPARIGRQLER